MFERWVGDWTNCNILTPSSFVFSRTSFSFCWAAQSGVLRAHSLLLGAGSLYSILSPNNWLQTNRTSCRTGLYHCMTTTCFLWALHLHPIQPVHGQGYTLLSSTGCTCLPIDGWAERQYVTCRLQVQTWLQAIYNTGILNTCTQLWLTESEQTTPVDSIKDVVWSSVMVPEFDKHLKNAGRHIGQNVVEITMKTKRIVQKNLMIKIERGCDI